MAETSSYLTISTLPWFRSKESQFKKLVATQLQDHISQYPLQLGVAM